MPPTSPPVNDWVGIIFYVPAVAGGIFGLLGGYLTDLLGRRRVLVWSILLYAFSAFAAGYSTSVYWLLFWRCCTFVGVCVEFVAAVAWLSELFPNPKQRESVVGYTQAFGSFGGLMVTGAYYLLVTYGHSLPEVRGGHEAWRYTLMSGVIPAIPLILIRPFLPESPAWRAEESGRHAASVRASPSCSSRDSARTTIVTTVMMACGVCGGVRRDSTDAAHRARACRSCAGWRAPRIEQTVSARAVVSGVRRPRGTVPARLSRGAHRQPAQTDSRLPDPGPDPACRSSSPSSPTQQPRAAEVGHLLRTASRRSRQFSFWGNYLPRVYPTYLRGTGESFAANVGGRMIGTMAALVTTQLANSMPGAGAPAKLAYASAVVGTIAYVIGLTASFWLPEPSREELPE